jgi:prepilin-type N-terminal cleavage/methylation domain-containing protein
VEQQRGFAALEVLIVVVMLALLFSIAVPGMISATENTNRRSCIANLHEIEAAKEQYAVEHHASNDTLLPPRALVPEYMPKWPVCQAGGKYQINPIDTPAQCSLAGNHTLPSDRALFSGG